MTINPDNKGAAWKCHRNTCNYSGSVRLPGADIPAAGELLFVCPDTPPFRALKASRALHSLVMY